MIKALSQPHPTTAAAKTGADDGPAHAQGEDKTQRSINDLIGLLDARMASILYAVEEVRKDAVRKAENTDFGVGPNMDRLIGSHMAAELASLKSRLETLHGQAKKALADRNFVLFNEFSNQVRELLEAKKSLADENVPKLYVVFTGKRRLSFRSVFAEYSLPLPDEVLFDLPEEIAAQWAPRKGI